MALSIKLRIAILDEFSLKDNSILNFNVSTDKLKSAIIDAQNIHIEPILGTDLYVKILTDIENSSLAGDYATLTEDYIIPALIQYSLYEASLNLSFEWFNGGIAQYSDGSQIPAKLNEIQYLRNQILNKAQYFSERLKCYLCDNSSKFPEYLSANDIVSNKKSSYFEGLTSSKNVKPFLR
jgi:hypothetical protein